MQIVMNVYLGLFSFILEIVANFYVEKKLIILANIITLMMSIIF